MYIAYNKGFGRETIGVSIPATNSVHRSHSI